MRPCTTRGRFCKALLPKRNIIHSATKTLPSSPNPRASNNQKPKTFCRQSTVWTGYQTAGPARLPKHIKNLAPCHPSQHHDTYHNPPKFPTYHVPYLSSQHHPTQIGTNANRFLPSLPFPPTLRLRLTSPPAHPPGRRYHPSVHGSGTGDAATSSKGGWWSRAMLHSFRAHTTAANSMPSAIHPPLPPPKNRDAGWLVGWLVVPRSSVGQCAPELTQYTTLDQTSQTVAVAMGSTGSWH